jgi:hypothetical protein
MKLITGILGCALAAGLMTFAADKAQAGVVIDNTLYSPLKIKVTFGYTDDKGVIKKMSITSKQVLKMFTPPKGTDLPKNAKLAINTGDEENDHIFVITKNSVLEDLTAEGILTADLNELLNSSSNGKNDQFKYKETGILSLYFYSNPQFNEELIVNNPNLNQSESEDSSDYWFEISGIYFYSERDSSAKSGKQSVSTSLKNSGVLSGDGYDVDLDYITTVKGSASAKGNGKLAVGG